MTMHLLGPAYTTNNTRKRKSKLSDSKYHKYCMDWLEDKRYCKKYGIKPKTLDEYIAYRQGKYKPNLKGTIKPPMQAESYRRESPKYPSYGDQIGVAFSKERQQYTGTKLIGIATLHKSNMVPVFSKEDAKDISRMRR